MTIIELNGFVTNRFITQYYGHKHKRHDQMIEETINIMSLTTFFSPHQSRELGISRIFAVNTKNCFIAVSIEDSINPIQNRCNPDRESFLTTEAGTPPCPSFNTSISAVNPNKSVLLVSLYVSQWPSTIILKIVLLKM